MSLDLPYLIVQFALYIMYNYAKLINLKMVYVRMTNLSDDHQIAVKKALESLFVDKRKMALEVALEAQGVLKIDETNCMPLLPFELSEFQGWARILLELATVYLCYLREIRSKEGMSREELAQRCELKPNSLRARLSELRRDRLVDSTEGGVTITSHGLYVFQQVLVDAKRDLEEDEEEEED